MIYFDGEKIYDIGNVIITNSKILSKISLINKNNLIQLLDISRNNNSIKYKVRWHNIVKILATFVGPNFRFPTIRIG